MFTSKKCIYVQSFLIFVQSSCIMSVKRKLNTKSLGEKCNALKDLENGMSNKEVAEKYGVPKTPFLLG